MKNQRVLDIFLRLLEGREINLNELALKYNVSPRSISRDISDLRAFLSENDSTSEIKYDRKKKKYEIFSTDENKLNNSEILAVCKILLDSRAFLKSEMCGIIDKLIRQCVPKESFAKVAKLVENEKYHYMELQHKKSFLNNLWEISDAVKNHLKMEVTYTKMNGGEVKRVINPVGLMFSEYYFYLLAHINNYDKEKYFKYKDDPFPTIYRLDRIKKYKVLAEHFQVPYTDRFQEGEFRKRVQFMTGGRLQKIKFKYFGNSLEAILDKIPTAVVLEKKPEYCIISAEVFGEGINRWILSQGKDIEVI